MADTSQQIATEINNTLRLSSHIQHVENRGTEPLGVVNIRSFQPHLSRVPGWAVQRSTVVNGILKRYSTQEKTSAYSDDLVLAVPSQAIPRDETLNISTTTQTATSSSVPIARAVRSESRNNRNSSPVKPSSSLVKSPSNPSTPQQLRKQGKSQPQSPLTVENFPKTPSLQYTKSTTSPSNLSGQFRVSRKPVPFPKPQTSTSSQSKLESVLSNQSSTKIDLPQTNISELNTSRDNISKDNISGDNALQITKSQPTIAREIASQGEISQTAASSLILPKRLQQENSLIPEHSISTNNELNRKSRNKGSLIQENLNQSSNQSNFVQLAPNQTQHQLTSQINPTGKEILNHQPQESAKSLILPKYLSQSSTENKSIKIEINQPTISQTTNNQPTIAREIANQAEIFQTATPSLILPKRLQKEDSQTTDSVKIIKGGDVKQHGKDSLIRQKLTHKLTQNLIDNSTQQNFIQFIPNNTQNQTNTVNKEILKHQPQQSTKSLILPKHLSQSSTENKSIRTDISQPTVSQATNNQPNNNQPIIAREITNQEEISQSPTPSLILPKRLQQENSPAADRVDIRKSDDRKTHTQDSLIQQKLTPNSTQNSTHHSTRDKKAQLAINHTQNQPTIIRKIANQGKGKISQAAAPYFILPKRTRQENPPTADSSNITKLSDVKIHIKSSLIQKKSTQHQITSQANIVSKEILNHQPQQSTELLILPKHLPQSYSEYSKDSSSIFQLGLENILNNQNSIKTTISQANIPQVNIPQTTISQKTISQKTPSQPTIAREIINQPEIFQTTTPSLILPKRLSETSTNNSQNSAVSNSNNLPTNTLQQKVERESSLKTPSVTITQKTKPLQVIHKAISPKEIASEIPSPVNVLNQQNMVWRKSISQASSDNLGTQARNSNNQVGTPLAINSVTEKQYISRQISNTSSPYSVSTEANITKDTTNTIPNQTNAQAHEISIEKIAEQVSRILHRNLSIERERRGMNLWY